LVIGLLNFYPIKKPKVVYGAAINIMKLNIAVYAGKMTTEIPGRALLQKKIKTCKID
jgi:hypothetical protein